MLDLINADRIVGQPTCTPWMLAEALTGRSTVDGEWWAQLAPPRTDVLLGRTGAPVGVVAYAMQPRDGSGILLWLHGREEPDTVGALVDHAAAALGRPSTLDAFDFATALGLGLEALPVVHRPATRAALEQRGFVGHDLWRYMHRRLPAPELPRAQVQVLVDGPAARRLLVRDGGAVLGEATVAVPVGGIGALWWIAVEPSARGRGIGRALLGSALDVLHRLGAGEVILYVDDDDPGSERDRTAANIMYERAGFVEVDRLHSFRLRAGDATG